MSTTAELVDHSSNSSGFYKIIEAAIRDCISDMLSSDDHNGDSSDHEYDVVCIGAGFAGLTAAHTLLKADSSLKICVLEAKGTPTYCYN